MLRPIDARESPLTCVWMEAGLLTYRLCDRNFDCEHCPLDAALHGLPPPLTIEREPVEVRPQAQSAFPDDRLYCPGHTWVGPRRADGSVRFGIDTFAASLMPPPQRLRQAAPIGLIRRSQSLCEVELECGRLHLAAPMDARVAKWNDDLGGDPGALVTSPYEEGWIAELLPAAADDLRKGAATSAAAAAQRARLDFRRLLRHIGQILLLEDLVHAAPASNGHPATDLRRIIGQEQFIALLQEFVR